ncbi:SPASM domain-containing protein [Acidobacteria bacterium AH-259-A15]|nr:SPASM domain-containing protein [Acidobacteria bacterium AH-259-A15]
MYRYPDFPDHVYVELTNVCNARCTICATPTMLRKRQIMPMPLFRKIVDECGRRKAKKILPFLHGESLLVPGVVDYFRYVRRAAPQTHVNLTTNGSKLSAELAETFLQEDLLDSVIVSIDGGNKETFEGIRLGLNYDQVRNNVLHFIRRRKQLGKSKPRVSIAMVTVKENKRTGEKLKEVWKEADEVRFSVYFNWAGKLENNGRTGHKINFCERLNHYITILADGRVAMCCFDSEAEYCVGDVTHNSIYEVWHSKAFDQKRSWLYERNFDQLKLCANCDYINHPAWTTPLVRIRPYVRETFPQLTTAAENLYKQWLMR